MDFVLFNQPCAYRHTRRRRRFTPVTGPASLSPERLYLLLPDEYAQLQPSPTETAPTQGSGEPARYQRVPAETVARRFSLPPLLGRAGLPAQQVCAQPERTLLPLQLQQLTPQTPGVYRLLIINTFGFALGDNLMGATALRYLLGFLAANGFNCRVDLLMSLSAKPFVAQCFADLPEVEQISSGGITLAQLRRYDGVFDFSRLISLPRYEQLPMVDFVLWWMGVNPDKVPPERKRNQLGLPAGELKLMQRLLRRAPGVRILLNRTASTPLRTLPESVAIAMAQALLDANPDWTLVVDQPFALEHPRLLNLAGKINSPQAFTALIAQMDGLIAVDSFGQHVADAYAIPTVLLLSSLPKGHFPYYPCMQILHLPGCEHLPGWGRVKLSNEEWVRAEPQYRHAWQQLDPQAVSTAMNQLLLQYPKKDTR